MSRFEAWEVLNAIVKRCYLAINGVNDTVAREIHGKVGDGEYGGVHDECEGPGRAGKGERRDGPGEVGRKLVG